MNELKNQHGKNITHLGFQIEQNGLNLNIAPKINYSSSTPMNLLF